MYFIAPAAFRTSAACCDFLFHAFLAESDRLDGTCHYTATCRSRSLPPDEQLLLALLLVGFLEQPHKRHVPGSCHLLTFVLHCLLHVQPRRPKPSSWPSRRIRSVLYGVVHLPILICRMCAAHTFIQYVSSFCPAILIFTVF